MDHDERQVNSDRSSAEPSRHGSPRIPDHELIRRIGRGAFGEVWLAKAISLNNAYRAVKVVYRASLDGMGFERELKGIQRFESISRSHPCLLQILHVGENVEGGYLYYVMELADDANSGNGREFARELPESDKPVERQDFDVANYLPKSLDKILRQRGRLPFEECLRISLCLSTGLMHLHRHGLLHRDIKPANIVFANGVAKLADIGLVANVNTAVTFVGTTGYIAPEGPGLPPADIYSLGIVLYEMVTGLDCSSFPKLPDNWGNQPSLEGLSRFNAIVLRACEADVTRRYKTVEELHAELSRLQDSADETLAGKSKGLARTAGIAALVLLLVGGFLSGYQWLKQRLQSRQNAALVTGLSADEASEGFVQLFNGNDLDGWSAPGSNWVCLSGSLTRVADGGDITYEKQRMPDDFDLRFEWKVSTGGDSGVLYRQPGRVEYQILDNSGSPHGEKAETWAGSLYDYAGGLKDQTKRVGRWNESRIICEADRIRHYLNGAVVLDTHYNTPEWKEAHDRLKARYGTDLNRRDGYLVLRDDGTPVWYRHIRMKDLTRKPETPSPGSLPNP